MLYRKGGFLWLYTRTALMCRATRAISTGAGLAAAGKQFAMVRVGSSNSGGLYVDPYFLQNVNGAKAAGLRVGAYYYTYARTRAAVANELTTFLNVMEGLQLRVPGVCGCRGFQA